MPSVRVFVLDEEKRVLLVHSNYDKKGIGDEFWVVPGGGIESGEYSRDAAIREVKEETGLDIEIVRLLWVVEEKTPEGQIDYCHYFLGETIGGKLEVGYDPELNENHQVILDVQFLRKEEIESLPRVYPESILNEFWALIDSTELLSYNPWRNRPSKGFGIK